MMQERRVVTVASFMIDGFVIICVMEDKVHIGHDSGQLNLLQLRLVAERGIDDVDSGIHMRC